MISVSGKKWEENKVNKNILDKFRQDHNLSDILSRLIITRKFDQNEIFLIENKLPFCILLRIAVWGLFIFRGGAIMDQGKCQKNEYVKHVPRDTI